MCVSAPRHLCATVSVPAGPGGLGAWGHCPHKLGLHEIMKLLLLALRIFLFLLFQVNENFAIDLIAEQPVSGADSRVVACDGGGGALGHPKVYINLVPCPLSLLS